MIRLKLQAFEALGAVWHWDPKWSQLLITRLLNPAAITQHLTGTTTEPMTIRKSFTDHQCRSTMENSNLGHTGHLRENHIIPQKLESNTKAVTALGHTDLITGKENGSQGAASKRKAKDREENKKKTLVVVLLYSTH